MNTLRDAARAADVANELPAADEALVKVAGNALAKLFSEFQAFNERETITRSGEPFSTSNTNLTVGQGGVVIEVVALDGDGAALLAELEALGLSYGGAFKNAVSGLFPIANLDQLPASANIAFAAPSYVTTNVGSVDNQAHVAMNTDDVSASLGVDGTGITIGILSDSFDTAVTAGNQTIDYADDIASGDLPAGINVLQDYFGNDAIDEGRAMAQLIHDIAPGADLEFKTAFLGPAAFAQSIQDLAVNSDVIVDDIGYLTQPFFQDGVIAQAVDTVFAAGKAYFSSAGNSGRASYEAAATTGSGTIFGLTNTNWHDWDPGAGVDLTQDFVLQAGQDVRISFQWDDPFITGAAGSGGAVSNVDIALFDTSNSAQLASGIDNNIGGDPTEFFTYTNNTGSAQNVALVVQYDSGTVPNVIKYIDFGSGVTANAEYATNSGTSFGHPSAEGGLGVGAAFYLQTPEFGQNPPLLENFSSAGGTPIYFDAAGNRLVTPEIRERVDITAPDGTDTTFFGDQRDGTAAPNFTGTSAAAPHAAALAALMLEADGTLTPTGIYDAMKDSAIDILSTAGGAATGVGYDDWSGHGLIDAIAAFNEAGIAVDDFGETAATAGAVTVNGSATGGIEAIGDVDWFGVDLIEGVTYTIDQTGNATGDGTLGDPEFRGIFDPSDVLIPGTADDDSGIGLNSQVVYTATETGLHHLAAAERGDNATGTYTVSVSTTDDFTETTATTGSVSVGSSAQGIIETSGDEDWFAVTLTSGVEYQIDLEGLPTEGGSLSDTFLRGIYDSTGAFVAGTTDDDGGINVNSLLRFTPDSSGTFYISAGAFGANAGTYTLTVRSDLRPDLIIESVTSSETVFLGGETTTVTYDLANIGANAAGASDTGIYLSTNTIISNGDTLLATDASSGALTGGGSETGTVTVNIPTGLAPGTYYIGAIADVNEAVLEVSVSNNFSDITSPPVEITIAAPGVELRDGTDAVVGEFLSIEDAFAAALDGYTIEALAAYGLSDEVITTGLDNLTLIDSPASGSGRSAITLSENGNVNFTAEGNGSVDIIGNTENNVLRGGDGNDSVRGEVGNDSVFGGEGNDTLFGNDGADRLSASSGDDSLRGGDGDDTLLGGDDNDTLRGEDGENQLFAGSGDDRAYGGDEADTITGASGNDLLVGRGGADSIEGGSDNDTLFGNDGDDTLFGEDGDDVISGGSQNDSLRGDAGDDTLNGGGDDDILRGDEGENQLSGDSGNDSLYGGGENDVLFGGSGEDRLVGGGGDDDVEGGTEDDVLFGGSGADTLDGQDGDDWLSGGNQADQIFGRAGNDTMRGGNDDDRFFGGTEDDVIAGNLGNDTLEGGSNDDRLFGGGGDDELVGGSGTDFMSGGAGDDVFVFESVTDSIHGSARDTISGFNVADDMIDLSGIMGGLTFVTSYTNTAGEVRYNDGIGRLYLDADGDGASDFSIDITGAPALTAADLIL